MTDSAVSSPHHGSPELAGLVRRTLMAMRLELSAEHASPTPSWAISIRFRLGGFRPRSSSQR